MYFNKSPYVFNKSPNLLARVYSTYLYNIIFSPTPPVIAHCAPPSVSFSIYDRGQTISYISYISYIFYISYRATH